MTHIRNTTGIPNPDGFSPAGPPPLPDKDPNPFPQPDPLPDPNPVPPAEDPDLPRPGQITPPIHG